MSYLSAPVISGIIEGYLTLNEFKVTVCKAAGAQDSEGGVKRQGHKIPKGV